MSAHIPSRQPKGLPVGGQFAASARNEASEISLASTLNDDDAQAADYMAFMDPGAPPEPETGHCAKCGDLWMADPDGSPGVKVHMDDETGRPDHDKDEDHTPVPEDDFRPPHEGDQVIVGADLGIVVAVRHIHLNALVKFEDGTTEVVDLDDIEHAGENTFNATTCTDESGHLSGSDHRWQECPTYDDDDDDDDDDDMGEDEEDEEDEEETDLDVTDDEILVEFQTLGSSSEFAVTRSVDTHEPEPFSLYRDGTWVGSFDYDGDPADHHTIEQTALRVFPIERTDEDRGQGDPFAAAARYALDINNSGHDDQVRFLARMGYAADRIKEIEDTGLLGAAVTTAARDVAANQAAGGGSSDDVWAILNNETPTRSPALRMTTGLAYRSNARYARTLLADHAASIARHGDDGGDDVTLHYDLGIAAISTLSTLRDADVQAKMTDYEHRVVSRLAEAVEHFDRIGGNDPVSSAPATGRLAEALSSALDIGDNHLGTPEA